MKNVIFEAQNLGIDIAYILKQYHYENFQGTKKLDFYFLIKLLTYIKDF